MNSTISNKQPTGQFSFQGFEIPQSNFFYMPREWLKIRAKYVRKCPSMIFVIEYILAHTWGWTYRDDDGNLVHEKRRHLTRDDFVNGRKKKDGSRYDNGTGLSESSVKNGLEMAEGLGFIEVEVDDRDKARIKKFYSLKMKATEPERSEEEKSNEPESIEDKSDNEIKNLSRTRKSKSREEALVTDNARGLTVTPPTVNPQRVNDYPSYIRVNNSSNNFSSSMIESEKIENEFVDNLDKEQLPYSNSFKTQPKIVNYEALTPDEKLMEISRKSELSAVKIRGATQDWKERLRELKQKLDTKKNHASGAFQRPRKRMEGGRLDDLPSKGNYAPQIENKTLVRGLEREIEELEKLVSSINFIGSDISLKLGDTKNQNKNITHLSNIYREAVKMGYSFITFRDIVYFVCSDVLNRSDVKNKGAYYFMALEQKLGLREIKFKTG